MIIPESLALGLLFVGLVYYRYIVHRRSSDVKMLPGPPGHSASWIWGHEKHAFENGLIDTYTKWAANFGTFYKIKGALFHPDIAVVTDYAAAHYIFQNYDDFVKAPQIRGVIEMLSGGNVISHEHDSYRRQRRLLAPAFSVEAVKGMMGDILECTARCEDHISAKVMSAGADTTLNISEVMAHVTMDIIGRTSFGHDFQGGESAEAQVLYKAWTVQSNAAHTFPIAVAQYILRAFPSILCLPLSLMSEAATVRDTLRSIAAQMLDRGDVDDDKRDVISFLRRVGKKNDADETLSRQELIDNATALMLAGQETTAGTLSFTLLELARQPLQQQRLRQEIRGVSDITYEKIQKSEYLDAVVKEGMRLHPASPSTERLALNEDIIPLSRPIHTRGGKVLSSVRVHKGQVIHIPFTAMHVDAAVWGPTAHEFVPERWITPGGIPSSELPTGWGGLFTFCDGPRTCIGYRLACLEMKVILAVLIRAFEFHDTGAIVEEQPKPTLQPRTDGRTGVLPMRVTLAT